MNALMNKASKQHTSEWMHKNLNQQQKKRMHPRDKSYLLDGVSRCAKPLPEASLSQFASRHQPVEIFLSFQRHLCLARRFVS